MYIFGKDMQTRIIPVNVENDNPNTSETCFEIPCTLHRYTQVCKPTHQWAPDL